MLVPIIMAGGSGACLWPLSHSLYQKQFLSLLGESTMLQATINITRMRTELDSTSQKGVVRFFKLKK